MRIQYWQNNINNNYSLFILKLKIIMKKLFLILLACITVQSYAQTSYETETFFYGATIKLNETGKLYGTFSFHFMIKYPQKGDTVEIYSAYSAGETDLDNEILEPLAITQGIKIFWHWCIETPEMLILV